MTSKASFYILNDTTPKARDLYTCQLIEKAYVSGKTVYVNLDNLKEAENFNTQLWTFRDISFVPHEIYNQNPNSKASVLIGYDIIPSDKKDILINLTVAIPEFCQQFNHVIEIVPNDNELKVAARKRYQAYQKLGYQMETFNINTQT